MGVIPVLSEQFKSIDVLFYHAQRVAQQTLQLREGDKVVMTGGITDGTSGNTNLIKVRNHLTSGAAPSIQRGPPVYALPVLQPHHAGADDPVRPSSPQRPIPHTPKKGSGERRPGAPP